MILGSENHRSKWVVLVSALLMVAYLGCSCASKRQSTTSASGEVLYTKEDYKALDKNLKKKLKRLKSRNAQKAKLAQTELLSLHKSGNKEVWVGLRLFVYRPRSNVRLVRRALETFAKISTPQSYAEIEKAYKEFRRQNIPKKRNVAAMTMVLFHEIRKDGKAIFGLMRGEPKQFFQYGVKSMKNLGLLPLSVALKARSNYYSFGQMESIINKTGYFRTATHKAQMVLDLGFQLQVSERLCNLSCRQETYICGYRMVPYSGTCYGGGRSYSCTKYRSVPQYCQRTRCDYRFTANGDINMKGILASETPEQTMQIPVSIAKYGNYIQPRCPIKKVEQNTVRAILYQAYKDLFMQFFYDQNYSYEQLFCQPKPVSSFKLPSAPQPRPQPRPYQPQPQPQPQPPAEDPSRIF